MNMASLLFGSPAPSRVVSNSSSGVAGGGRWRRLGGRSRDHQRQFIGVEG